MNRTMPVLLVRLHEDHVTRAYLLRSATTSRHGADAVRDVSATASMKTVTAALDVLHAQPLRLRRRKKPSRPTANTRMSALTTSCA
jgi:hypothetical protein